MPANEEVQEHVHAAHDPFERTVAGTMAIVAAFLAIVSVLGQHFSTEEVIHEQESADQWAYSQAKDVRRYTAQVAQDILTNLKADPALVSRYAAEGARYDKERHEIQTQARELQSESARNGRRADRFHVSEVFLEIALVFSSLSILSKIRSFFWFGASIGFIGLLSSLTVWFP